MTYTFADHITAYQTARQRANGGTPLPTYVQTKIGPETACARILDYWESSEGQGMWQLELLPPFSGRTHRPCNRVRPCSGVDGLCACAHEQTVAGGEGAPACGVASPLAAGEMGCSKNRQAGRDVLVTRHFSFTGEKNHA